MASSSGVVVPANPPPLEFREPAGRGEVGPHAEPDTTIPVHLTVPGIRFVRSARLTVEEFVRHFIGWFVVHRFMSTGRLPDRNAREFPRRNNLRVLTRCGAFDDCMAHLPHGCFNNDMVTDRLIDYQVFRHRSEREFHERFEPRLLEFLHTPLVNINRYESYWDVPLSLFGAMRDDPYVSNHRRRGRDADTSARMRDHGFHASGHDTYFWSVPVPQRRYLWLQTTWRRGDLYCEPYGPRILGVPAAYPATVYAGFVSQVRRDVHTYRIGSTETDEARQNFLTQQLGFVDRAHALFRSAGRFFCSALAGASYGHHDSALTCRNWGRFVGILTPLNDMLVEFVDHYGFEALLGVSSGWPLDLVWMAYDRSLAVDWDFAAENGYYTAVPYFRYDPRNGDIDDLPQRWCGPNFDDRRIGAEVRFHSANVETVNELPPMAWYRYEVANAHGPGAWDWTVTFGDEDIHSNLNSGNPTATDRDAIERRDYPFGRTDAWYRNRARGVGIRTVGSSAPITSMEEVGAEIPRAKALGPIVAPVSKVQPDPRASFTVAVRVPVVAGAYGTGGLNLSTDTPVEPGALTLPAERARIEEEFMTRLVAEVLVPMRQILTASGFLQEGATAEGVLPHLAEVPAHYRRLINSVGTAGGQLTALRTEVAELTPRAALADERHQRIEALEQELAELRTARDTANGTVQQLNTRVTELEEERDTLATRLDTTTTHLNAANGRVGGLEQVCDQYAANANAALAQAQARETQRDAAVARSATLEAERVDARDRNETLEQERDAARNRSVAAELERNASQTRSNTLINENTAAVARAEALQLELNQTRAALASAPMSARDRASLVEVSAHVGRSVTTIARVAQEAGDAVARIQHATESTSLGALFGDADLGADIRSRIAAQRWMGSFKPMRISLQVQARVKELEWRIVEGQCCGGAGSVVE